MPTPDYSGTELQRVARIGGQIQARVIGSDGMENLRRIGIKTDTEDTATGPMNADAAYDIVAKVNAFRPLVTALQAMYDAFPAPRNISQSLAVEAAARALRDWGRP